MQQADTHVVTHHVGRHARPGGKFLDVHERPSLTTTSVPVLAMRVVFVSGAMDMPVTIGRGTAITVQSAMCMSHATASETVAH